VAVTTPSSEVFSRSMAANALSNATPMFSVFFFISLQRDLERKGMHPKLGLVTMRNLLSTWVIHDLTHIAQITRVMAKQLKEHMGPWQEYFRIVHF
jgi:hypothetical protein